MSEKTDSSVDLWDFIPVDQYAVPSDAMTVGKARKKINNFIYKLQKKKRTSESPLTPDDNLLSISGDDLNAALPALNLKEGAAKLENRLNPWLESEAPSKPVIFYLAPPFCERQDLLVEWARIHGAYIVAPPQPKEILGGWEKWFQSWPQKAPWVLPNLEKCFLRQASGLDFVRELLSRMLSGEFGLGVLGCDGWAWSFLQQVWLGRPSFTITTPALEAEMMKSFFQRSILDKSDLGLKSFRQADNGVYLLDHSEKKSLAPDGFWHHLAGYSRGNAGVAAACWQRALKTLPADGLKDEADESRRGHKNTIWVTPWKDLFLPTYPEDEGETALFVLHSLLIHDGLNIQTLADMLPSDHTGLTEVLLFLRESELVEEKEEQEGMVWKVTAAGYPAVRKKLAAHDYFCDPF